MSWIDLGRVLLVALLLPSNAATQLQISTLKGIVADAQQQVVVGATIVLQDSTGTTVATRTTVADGSFQPEFGFKSGGVVEVRSQTGLDTGWSGTLDTGVADTATRHVEVPAPRIL